jgi:hypothetical protein
MPRPIPLVVPVTAATRPLKRIRLLLPTIPQRHPIGAADPSPTLLLGRRPALSDDDRQLSHAAEPSRAEPSRAPPREDPCENPQVRVGAAVVLEHSGGLGVRRAGW